MTLNNPSSGTVEDGRRGIIYIDSKLDDYGLTTKQFRVYCHMARRASSRSREAWPSVASIAKICRMREDSARESLSDLVEMGLLRFRDNPGKTRIYTLTDSSEWAHPSQSQKPYPSGLGGVPRNDPSAFGGGHPSPGSGGDPSGLGGDEVYPLKVIQEGSPSIESAEQSSSLKAAPSQCEAPHVPAAPPVKSRERFTPPTRAELDLEAAKHGLPETQVTQFECFYGSKGWTVGKSPMKSWKLALAGWANRWRESGGRFQNQSTPPKPKPFHPHQKLIDEIRAKLASHPADMQRVLDSGRQPTQEESREYSQLRDKLAELMMDNGGGK